MKKTIIAVVALLMLAVPISASGQPDALNATADVSIPRTAQQTVVPDPIANIGETVTYSWEVVNLGPDAASDVVFKQASAAVLEFVSASSGCSNAGSVVTCNLGTLASGASAKIVIVTRLASGTCGALFRTDGSVSASSTDPVATNNSLGQVLQIGCGVSHGEGDHGHDGDQGHGHETPPADHHGSATTEDQHTTTTEAHH